MTYLDTSFLIPYYAQEPTTQGVEGFLQRATPGAVFVSAWTRVEFASAMARQVRMNNLSHQQATTNVQALDEDIGERLGLIGLNDADYGLAADLLLRDPAKGLRGPDALHLATAMSRQLTLYSLDKTLIRAARAFGVSATSAGILADE